MRGEPICFLFSICLPRTLPLLSPTSCPCLSCFSVLSLRFDLFSAFDPVLTAPFVFCYFEPSWKTRTQTFLEITPQLAVLMRMWNMEMEHTPCHRFLSNKSFRPLTKPQIGLPIFKAVPFITLIHLLRDGNPHLPAITTYSHTHTHSLQSSTITHLQSES